MRELTTRQMHAGDTTPRPGLNPCMQEAKNTLTLLHALQEASGRLISARYSVLSAFCYNHSLYAVVCPDSATATAQRPCALRVYALNLQALSWRLVSPAKGDEFAYPLPRMHAACCRHGDKVRAPFWQHTLEFWHSGFVQEGSLSHLV
jgi:hypothetical protein